MKYFDNFPIIKYTLPLDGYSRTITDITKRFNPIAEVMKKATLFYDFAIRDGQTPEIVSDIFYSTMEYHWIIMMFNQVFDNNYQWPMTEDEFFSHILLNYTSESYAKNTVKNYYHIVQQETNYQGVVIKQRKNIIDLSIYNTLDDYERDFEYIWDYEFRLNEERRNIKILDSSYVAKVLIEKERIFN